MRYSILFYSILFATLIFQKVLFVTESNTKLKLKEKETLKKVIISGQGEESWGIE